MQGLDNDGSIGIGVDGIVFVVITLPVLILKQVTVANNSDNRMVVNISVCPSVSLFVCPSATL